MHRDGRAVTLKAQPHKNARDRMRHSHSFSDQFGNVFGNHYPVISR